MFDLFGNLQEQQAEMAKKMAEIIVEHQSDDGLIKIKVNGLKEILDLSISRDKVNLEDIEQLEDLLLITLNQAFEKAGDESEKVSQQAINDILPGGLGNLGDLFGQ